MINNNEQKNSLSISELKNNIDEIIDRLKGYKIISRDGEDKAVIISYDAFKLMDSIIEEMNDEVLTKISEKRLIDKENNFIGHKEFWEDI